MLEGMLLINKPSGMTSHDVVQVVRRKLGVRRIGHTGTLDPMAEGLLILLVGEATRYQQAFQGHDKTYEAVLELGTQTDTADATGTPIRTADVPSLDRESIAQLLTSFTGSFAQTPPAYSAVKVQGHPAYWWTRRQKPVTLSSRVVCVSNLSLLDYHPRTLMFRVDCSAGTYIRSLAEAIAERLGTVGHLSRLVRLRVGQWRLDDAQPLSWINQASLELITRQLRRVS